MEDKARETTCSRWSCRYDERVDAGSVWMDIIGEHGKRFAPLDVTRLRKMFPAKKIEAALKFAEQETRDAARTIRALSEGLGKERAAKAVARLKEAVQSKVADEDLEVVTTALQEDLQWSLAPPATRYTIAASAHMVARAVREDLNQVLTVSALPPDELVAPHVALALPFVVGKAGLGECLLQEVPDVVQEAAEAIQNQVTAMSTSGTTPTR